MSKDLFESIKAQVLVQMSLQPDIPPSLPKLEEVLRFKIGEQYEKYEFDLESDGEVELFGKVYEKYKYVKGDFQSLFEIPLSRGITHLYNADILCAVYFRIGNENKFFKFWMIYETINALLTEDKKMKFTVYDKWAIAKLDTYNILISYPRNSVSLGLSIQLIDGESY